MEFIQQALTVKINKVQNVLDNINTMDLLTMFFYFNLITLRFEKPQSITKAKKVNPNLLK